MRPILCGNDAWAGAKAVITQCSDTDLYLETNGNVADTVTLVEVVIFGQVVQLDSTVLMIDSFDLSSAKLQIN